MSEPGIHPLRATLLVLLSAGALAIGTLVGLSFGHPFLGAASGYAASLVLAANAFRPSTPERDDVFERHPSLVARS